MAAAAYIYSASVDQRQKRLLAQFLARCHQSVSRRLTIQAAISLLKHLPSYMGVDAIIPGGKQHQRGIRRQKSIRRWSSVVIADKPQEVPYEQQYTRITQNQ